jgi:hypothetical protein
MGAFSGILEQSFFRMANSLAFSVGIHRLLKSSIVFINDEYYYENKN